MSDIVHWLRKLADLVDEGHDQRHVVAHMRAGADEIERLRADNQKAALEYLGQIGQLSDENTRLRSALEEVRTLVFGANHSEARYPLARAALGGEA